MKDTGSKALLGILLVLFGVALACRAMGIFYFNIFFRGWWTMFIIIPSLCGLSRREKRTSSVIGLGIGILLLLSAQGALQWHMFWQILLAFVFIVIGCSIMFKRDNDGSYTNDTFDQYSYGQDENDPYGNTQSYSYDNMTGENNDTKDEYQYDNINNNSNNGSDHGENSNFSSGQNANNNHTEYVSITGFLSGRTAQFVDEVFTGAVVTSILGNVQIDLRNAIFTGNAAIETTCILGGVDIYVPNNVKVVNNCMSILAGVDNKVVSPLNHNGERYTLFINGSCILGGIEVK